MEVCNITILQWTFVLQLQHIENYTINVPNGCLSVVLQIKRKIMR